MDSLNSDKLILQTRISYRDSAPYPVCCGSFLLILCSRGDRTENQTFTHEALYFPACNLMLGCIPFSMGNHSSSLPVNSKGYCYIQISYSIANGLSNSNESSILWNRCGREYVAFSKLHARLNLATVVKVPEMSRKLKFLYTYKTPNFHLSCFAFSVC